MKFKRSVAAFCSSTLIFCLSFLPFPRSNSSTVTDTAPVATATPAPLVTATPTPLASDSSPDLSVATPTPVPAFTDTLEAPANEIKDVVINYINAYYDNDYTTASALVNTPEALDADLMKKASQNISKVESIELYSYPGINRIHSIVYVSLSLYYKDLQLFVPQFFEYYIEQQSDGSYLIYNAALTQEENDAFFRARKTEAVQNVAISSLIRRYHVACLVVNEPMLKQCVTDSDYLNVNFISSRYSFTDSFSDYSFLLYPGINEFEYIAFVTHKEKIFSSDTPAPCMEYYYIDVNDLSGRPFIYLGLTSLDTDAYCAAVIQSEEIQDLAQQVNLDMQNALKEDTKLSEFYEQMISNSPGEEE